MKFPRNKNQLIVEEENDIVSIKTKKLEKLMFFCLKVYLKVLLN